MKLNNNLKKLRKIFYRDKYIYLCCYSSVVIYLLFYFVFYQYLFLNIEMYRDTFLQSVACAFIFLLIFLYFSALLNKRKSLVGYYIIFFKKNIIYWSEFVNGIFLFLSISFSISIYSSLKLSIPHINSYYLDPFLSAIDRAIYGGKYAWEITHKIFSHPLFLYFFDFLYTSWVLIVWLFFVVIMISVKTVFVRERFIISFLLCWILIGGLLAVFFSSVGPCFFDKFYTNTHDSYLPLMELIKTKDEINLSQLKNHYFDIKSLKLQYILWRNYLSDGVLVGSGISAMPSMHVSMLVLITCFCYHINKKIFGLSLLYTILVSISTVYLGWHYSIDCYASVIFTISIWKLVGEIQAKIYNDYDKNLGYIKIKPIRVLMRITDIND